jgi:hypothetical protein
MAWRYRCLAFNFKVCVYKSASRQWLNSRLVSTQCVCVTTCLTCFMHSSSAMVLQRVYVSFTLLTAWMLISSSLTAAWPVVFDRPAIREYRPRRSTSLFASINHAFRASFSLSGQAPLAAKPQARPLFLRAVPCPWSFPRIAWAAWHKAWHLTYVFELRL